MWPVVAPKLSVGDVGVEDTFLEIVGEGPKVQTVAPIDKSGLLILLIMSGETITGDYMAVKKSIEFACVSTGKK